MTNNNNDDFMGGFIVGIILVVVMIGFVVYFSPIVPKEDYIKAMNDLAHYNCTQQQYDVEKTEICEDKTYENVICNEYDWKYNIKELESVKLYPWSELRYDLCGPDYTREDCLEAFVYDVIDYRVEKVYNDCENPVLDFMTLDSSWVVVEIRPNLTTRANRIWNNDCIMDVVFTVAQSEKYCAHSTTYVETIPFCTEVATLINFTTGKYFEDKEGEGFECLDETRYELYEGTKTAEHPSQKIYVKRWDE